MIKKYIVMFIGLCFGVSYADSYITQDIVGGCNTTDLLTINNKTILTPIFEPIEYTCSAGSFLPANSTKCAPCPSNFNCPGGIFAFNETKAKGIIALTNITQNAAKICSTNVLMTTPNNKTHLKPIFEPNTVTLNYDNGNGTISSGTCTYDDLITLPETPPTRPGYTFSGWKLQQQNNNN